MPRHRIQTAEEDANADEESAPGQKPKIKRPRKPRRCQLEDNYPPIIQVSISRGESCATLLFALCSIIQKMSREVLKVGKRTVKLINHLEIIIGKVALHFASGDRERKTASTICMLGEGCPKIEALHGDPRNRDL